MGSQCFLIACHATLCRVEDRWPSPSVVPRVEVVRFCGSVPGRRAASAHRGSARCGRICSRGVATAGLLRRSSRRCRERLGAAWLRDVACAKRASARRRARMTLRRAWCARTGRAIEVSVAGREQAAPYLLIVERAAHVRRPQGGARKVAPARWREIGPSRRDRPGEIARGDLALRRSAPANPARPINFPSISGVYYR